MTLAGYILYSLDGKRVESFLRSPTQAEIEHFAEQVSQCLDQYDTSFEKGEPMKDWPSDPAELASILRQYLAKPDWYCDWSDEGKQLWQDSFEALCCDRFGHECESDGIYWNVIEEAVRHHGVKPDTITDLEVTHFGTRPFRYFAKTRSFDQWCPYHSMHRPDEVKRLIEQMEEAENRIRTCRHEEASDDYDELMPILDRIVKRDRVLHVGVDT